MKHKEITKIFYAQFNPNDSDVTDDGGQWLDLQDDYSDEENPVGSGNNEED